MAARTDAQKCDQLKEDLAKCLAESDCIRVHRRTAKECLRDHVEELSPECQQAYHGYVDCKRSLWDMRTRMRGVPGGHYRASSNMFAAMDQRGS